MKNSKKNNEIKNIHTNFSSLNNWMRFENDLGLGLFRGYVHNFNKKSLLQTALALEKNRISSFLKSIDGHFCLIIIKKNFSIVAVDKVRSIPIIYAVEKNELILSDNGEGMLKKIKLGPKDIDLFSSRLFALAGYSFNNNTLYKNIKQINPGSFLTITKNNLKLKSYFTWMPWKTNKSKNRLKALHDLNNKIIKKLIKSCKGKQIVVPLSGGLDSRFIVAGLKHFGYSNVICVSYGISGNKDVAIAEEVSKKLGYKWIYIKYTSKKFREAFYSSDYKKYLKYCDNFTSIHFAGEYLMLKDLKSRQLIDERAIIVNGQSGDFISGNHIPKNLLQEGFSFKKRLSFLVDEHTNNHYKHWKSLINKNVYNEVKHYFKKMIKQIGGLPIDPNKDYAVLEFIEFINRQSKYVINGQRNYEYFGYDWRLPLWDDEYLKFWAQANLEEKMKQNIYVKVLKKVNWGNVWNNIEVNPLIISPKWIIPIRLIAKIMFIPFGKEKWHSFERKYLDYFMTTTCCYGPWSYSQIIKDKRGHHSPIGWLIEDYLKNKGLNWKGDIN